MNVWLTHALAGALGICIGIFAAAFLQNELDERQVRQGFVEYRGALFMLVPAKPVPAP